MLSIIKNYYCFYYIIIIIIITVSLSIIENAYIEISKWQKNTLFVPYGKVERKCLDKMTEHINDWNNGSKMQPIALKAAIVLLAVGLEKPYQKSKGKDHQECLAKRLVWYCTGYQRLFVRGFRFRSSLKRSRLRRSCLRPWPKTCRPAAYEATQGTGTVERG